MVCGQTGGQPQNVLGALAEATSAVSTSSTCSTCSSGVASGSHAVTAMDKRSAAAIVTFFMVGLPEVETAVDEAVARARPVGARIRHATAGAFLLNTPPP